VHVAYLPRIPYLKGGNPRRRAKVNVQSTHLLAMGVDRGADMSLTGFHPLLNKIFSQNLLAIADQRCDLKGSSPYKGTAYRGGVLSTRAVTGHLTGRIPDPRRQLEEGQCAMPMPLAANCFISALSSSQQWANHTSSLSQPTCLHSQN
jgi:hypothetical protein